MPGHDLIVVGASAGGVEALSSLVKNLSADIEAAILIVLHVPPHSYSVLPQILQRAGKLPAAHAQNGQAIVTGRIYVAPPNYHLIVKPGHLHLVRGPRENSHRPSVDTLFRSAARAYGARVIGVVLTGALDDGTAGLLAVKMRGGVAVVQSPEDALYPGMPRSAIANVNDIDYILPLAEIPAVLLDIVNTPVPTTDEDPVPSEIEFESELADFNMAAIETEAERPGKPSSFACPDCGGTLWEYNETQMLRFRCRTGHAFSAETLLAEKSDALEEALWSALRALEEKSSLAQRMAQRLRDRNSYLSAQRLEEDAKESKHRAALIRQVLLKDDGMQEFNPMNESDNHKVKDNG